MLVSFNRLLLVLSVSVVATLAAPTINHDKEKLERKKGKHLIQLDKDSNPVWMTEEEELELIKADKHFVSSQSILSTYDGLSVISMLTATSGIDGYHGNRVHGRLSGYCPTRSPSRLRGQAALCVP